MNNAGMTMNSLSEHKMIKIQNESVVEEENLNAATSLQKQSHVLCYYIANSIIKQNR